MESEKKYKNKKKAIVIFTLSLAILVVITMAVCLAVLLAGATNRDNELFFNIDSGNLQQDFKWNSISKRPFEFTDDDINTELKFQLSNFKTENSGKSYQIITHNLAIHFKDNNAAEIYADVEYADIRFLVKLITKISFDDIKSEFIFKVSESYIGWVPIPVETTLDYLKQCDLAQIGFCGLTFQSSSFKFPTSSLFDETSQASEIKSIITNNGKANID